MAGHPTPSRLRRAAALVAVSAVMLAAVPAGPVLAQQAQGDDLGEQVFTGIAEPACAVCHSLDAAEATGTLGPDLDAVKPTADHVREVVTNGMEAMPAFAGKLTEEQIRAVSDYVARVSGGSG